MALESTLLALLLSASIFLARHSLCGRRSSIIFPVGRGIRLPDPADLMDHAPTISDELR
jgi:hypothetical protein